MKRFKAKLICFLSKTMQLLYRCPMCNPIIYFHGLAIEFSFPTDTLSRMSHRYKKKRLQISFFPIVIFYFRNLFSLCYPAEAL